MASWAATTLLHYSTALPSSLCLCSAVAAASVAAHTGQTNSIRKHTHNTTATPHDCRKMVAHKTLDTTTPSLSLRRFLFCFFSPLFLATTTTTTTSWQNDDDKVEVIRSFLWCRSLLELCVGNSTKTHDTAHRCPHKERQLAISLVLLSVLVSVCAPLVDEHPTDTLCLLNCTSVSDGHTKDW